MSILLSLLLTQAPVLPQIDRRALEQQARAEAVQDRRPGTGRAVRTASQAVGRAGDTRPSLAAQREKPPISRRLAQRELAASVRPASAGALDLSEITNICRAASRQADAASFLSTLARIRSLSATQSVSLRTGCAAYQAGRADARVSNSGTPGL